jgi:hypothetical protein
VQGLGGYRRSQIVQLAEYAQKPTAERCKICDRDPEVRRELAIAAASDLFSPAVYFVTEWAT